MRERTYPNDAKTLACVARMKNNDVTYDAAELARLRTVVNDPNPMPFLRAFGNGRTVLSLIDALEKARGERDELAEENRFVGEQMQKCAADNYRLEAERDSAHALLRNILQNHPVNAELCARIRNEIGEVT